MPYGPDAACGDWRVG